MMHAFLPQTDPAHIAAIMSSQERFKVIIYVPKSHEDAVKQAGTSTSVKALFLASHDDD